MKPTRNTAYLTITTAVISALMLLLTYFIQHMALNISDFFRYGLPFIPITCFAWFMVFAISILKHTREKAFVVNTFIIYLVYHVLQHFINIGIRFLDMSASKMLLYYEIIAVINVLAVILLVVAVFMLSETEYRTPLRVFALSELFIMAFFMLMPILVAFIGSTYFRGYYQYMGLASLVVPAAELYMAVSVLNVLNNQPWQKPFHQTENPQWPPYDEPGM